MSIKYLFTLLLLAGAPLFVQADDKKEEPSPQEFFAIEDETDEDKKDPILACDCGCGGKVTDEEEELTESDAFFSCDCGQREGDDEEEATIFSCGCGKHEDEEEKAVILA